MEERRLMDFLLSLRACVSIIYLLAPPTHSALVPDTEGGDVPMNYGVLLDAGSTSTKLKIYRWNPPSGDALVSRLIMVMNERFKPALSSYEFDTPGLTSYMDQILTAAKVKVPSSQHETTPIFLMATAGMRFLTARDAIILMDNTRKVLTNKTLNPFQYSPSDVNILSGEEEGVYSWMAANYLLGFFDSHKPTNESVGVLEMGGGSTQITFIPNGPLYSEEFQVSVSGRQYELYVQSYLQYGSTAIKQQVAHVLTKRYPGQTEFNNSCMLKGDKARARLEDGKWVTERGVGEPAECVKILQEILRPHTGIACQPKPCAIGGVYQPDVDDMHFYATQAFVYAPNNLNVIGPDEILHINRLEEAAYKHCAKTLRQAVEEDGLNERYASDDCLMGLYIPTLLTLSYGFSRDTTNIKVTSVIGKERIDWALGAMLTKISAPDETRFAVTCKSTDPDANGGDSSHRWSDSMLLICMLICSTLKYL